MSLLLISVKYSISSTCLSISVTVSLWSTWVYIVMASGFLIDTYILVCYIRQQENLCYICTFEWATRTVLAPLLFLMYINNLRTCV